MSALVRRLKHSGWQGVGYLALLIILPAFVGIPLVLWLVKQHHGLPL